VSVAAEWHITPGHLSGACRSRTSQRALVAVLCASIASTLATSDGCLCVPKIVDVWFRREDAGCQLSYLPHATEEDHGAHPFKARAGIAALIFAGGDSSQGAMTATFVSPTRTRVLARRRHQRTA
jgi:hypothetical protein